LKNLAEPPTGRDPARPRTFPHWFGLGGLLAASFVAYWGMATRGEFHVRQTYAPYFVYLADAFLHGQTHLRVLPPDTRELAIQDGCVYVYQPPMPGILLMPFVAFWGVDSSDRIFSAALGAINVVLLLLVGRATQRKFGSKPRALAWVVIFWALGSDQTSSVLLANVYALPHVLTGTFQLVAVLIILGRPFTAKPALLAGAALAAAHLTRIHTVLAAPLLLWAWSRNDSRAGGPTRTQRRNAYLGFVFAIGLGIFATLSYTRARFKEWFASPIDYQYMGAAGQLTASGEAPPPRHERLSVKHLPQNLYYYFLNLRLRRANGWPVLDPIGNALWFTSPFLLLLLLRCRSWWREELVRRIFLGAIPILCFVLLWPYTGAVQVGLRYVGDFLALCIPALIIAASATGRNTAAVLLVLSVVIRLYGTAMAPLSLNLPSAP
jgi:hypothetical protein